MAQYPQEQLEKLLKFLNDEVIHEPANAWFVDKLYKRLSQKRPSLQEPPTIKNIEKYLGLDINLDKINPYIDYSFIHDDFLRDCFKADWREMLRFRFGTRRHRIEFNECCRYAMLQIERAINCYYASKGVTIQEQSDYIKKYNEKYSPSSNNISIEAIPFSIKIWAYFAEFKLDFSLKTTIDKIANVRNSQSHGSSKPDSDKIFFDSHKAYLLRLGYPLKSNGLVDWKTLETTDPQKYNVYTNSIKNSDEHKRYISLEWQFKQPFDEVFNAVNDFITHISPQLSQL